MSIKVTCDAFEDGQRIPIRYTKEGENCSPPLRFENIPAGTKELAIICDDPDAPRAEPFVHWVAYHIPADCAMLPEGIPQNPVARFNGGADEIAQGDNSFHDAGYDGPMPPRGHGLHHYHFKVYALDQPLQVQPHLDNKALIASMSGHILDVGEIVGVYERK